MGIDQSTGRPGNFAEEISANIKEIADNYTTNETPKEVGRIIGIKKKR